MSSLLPTHLVLLSPLFGSAGSRNNVDDALMTQSVERAWHARHGTASQDRVQIAPTDGALNTEANDGGIGSGDIEEEPDGLAPSRGRGVGEAHAVHLNLVAMIDVVFLLLCYFLLSASFTLGERLYDLNLPDETSGADDEVAPVDDPFALPERPVRITVHQVGGSAGEVQFSVDVPGVTIRDAEDLYRYLSTNRVDDGNPTALFMPDTPVFIQPTAGTAWEHAVDAFNAAVRAEYTVIRFVSPGG